MGVLQASRKQADAVNAVIADCRADHEAEQAPKTVSDKWPDFHNGLLKLCHVDNEENLPVFWTKAAAWKKGSGITQRGILQFATTEAARKLGVRAPQGTLKQSTDILNWAFTGPTQCSRDANEILP